MFVVNITNTQEIRMQVLKITLLLTLIVGNAYANIPSKNYIVNKIGEAVGVKEDPQVLELSDIKIIIPTSGPVESESCMILVHSKKDLKDMYEASEFMRGNINNNSDRCPLLGEINNINKNQKINLKDKKSSPWNFSFHFGFTRTFYNNTDMRLKSDRLDVTIKDFEIDERTSHGFYNPANWEKWDDSFRWIDEPTNHFILTAEKNGHSIILSIFHPKFLKKQYQTKHVIGTVDGVEVNDFIEINEEFDGYNNQLGEMYLVRFENTHMQMAWQVGYGYEIKLIESIKFGTFSVRPAIFIGVMSGQHYDVYIQEGEYWEFDDHKDPHIIQGPMASVGLRINYKIKNFNFFVDGKYSYAQLKHGYGNAGGTAEFDLSYKAIAFGVGYTIPWNKKKNKKKKRAPKF